MKPSIRLLDKPLIERILQEAFELLMKPGIRVAVPEVIDSLLAAGASVENGVAHIPPSLVEKCLATVPREFHLFNRQGQPVAHYGGDSVQFDPGSSCVEILDSETLQPRPALRNDLVNLVRVTESLPQYAAQSTAMVSADAPAQIGDLYRLSIVLQYSQKPVVTGSFSAAGLKGMIDLLAADAGGIEALKARPRAVFDVCPSPPLNWSEFGAHNLVELARAGVPAELVSMPLAGGAAPVTLAGSITQHAAESLAGIVIHQLASPGAPIVWGGAPAIFDMRTGTTPMGAIETVMLNMGCAEIGKSLGLPTHGYMVATESKLVDYQAGAESARSAVLGALSGINMISGAGMIDSLACHSIEKLIIDAESIASAQRLISGVVPRGDSLATGAFAQIGHSGEFLKLKETRALFRLEQHIPGDVIDRSSRQEGPATDTFQRAKAAAAEILSDPAQPTVSSDTLTEFNRILAEQARRFGAQLAVGT